MGPVWLFMGHMVCRLSVNTCNPATNVRIFFLNRWEYSLGEYNYTFCFCKILNLKKIISISIFFLEICQITFLAPPAERQRSFSNNDSSVVRLSICLSIRSSRLRGGGVYLRNASVTFLLFSSAVPSGSVAFQMPTRPSSSSALSAASTLRGGEGPISETLQ